MINRHLLKSNIETLLNNRETIYLIYDELRKDEAFKPTFNKNGLFFDINLLSDETINNIKCIIDDITIDTKEKLIYTSYDKTFNEKNNNDDNELNDQFKEQLLNKFKILKL